MRERKTEALIVGAGPVGLWTALSLARAGVQVELVDREERTTAKSYACALHPRTLTMLERAGLGKAVIGRGRRVETIAFYDGERREAEIKLSELGGDFPFLLILPQSALEEVLEDALQQKNGVRVEWNHRFDGFEEEENSIVGTVDRLGGTAIGYIVPHWETVVIKRQAVRAQFLIGADGHNSLVRQRLGVGFEKTGESEAFAAIEFLTESEPANELRVVMDDRTTNVLWPLPGNRCRWTFQLIRAEVSVDFPEKQRRTARAEGRSSDEDVRRWAQSVANRRAPWFNGGIQEIAWCTQVGFEHRMVTQFGRDRVWLLGDAAHQTGPVGVQSMNVGLAEAEALAWRIQSVLREEAPLATLSTYERARHTEWRQLLGLSGGLRPLDGASDWARSRCSRILSCLPGSGPDLNRLAGQLGLALCD